MKFLWTLAVLGLTAVLYSLTGPFGIIAIILATFIYALVVPPKED